MNVADGRGEASVALLAVFVLQVDAEYSFAALTYGDVAYKYILDDSTAACAGLDADDTVEVRTVHRTVLGKHVAASAGYLAADRATGRISNS